VADGTTESYIAAIRKVMEPSNGSQIEAMCKSAQEFVRNEYTFERHCERMLEILDEALEDYYKKGNFSPG